MKKLTLGILLAACALPAAAESNFSAELLVGQAVQKSTLDIVDISTSGDDLSLGIRGAYKLNQNIAFELAYQDYGEAEDSLYTDNIKVSSSAINAGVKGILPVENGFSLHARLGIAFWDAEVEVTSPDFPDETLTADDDGTDLYVGFGLQYDISPDFVVGVEYDYTSMDASWDGVPVDNEVKNLSLSLGYYF